jgi:hypothetical protein
VTAQVAVTVSGHGAPSSTVDAAPAAVRVYTLRAVSIDLDLALDEAVAADERVPTFQLLADWNGDDGYSHRYSNLTRMVESFTLTQELATDLPAQIGFVEGTAATKLNVSLGGTLDADNTINPDGTYIETGDTIRAFSPYGISGPGPLLNRSVQLRTGFQTPQGPVSILQFTGKLSGYSPTASTREVVLDCLDPVSQLRYPITQYAFGIDGELLNQVGNIKYPFAINTQWFIDRILRNCGFWASPPPGGGGTLDAVTLSATMHGSYQQEIGSLAYVTTGYFPGANGAHTTVPFRPGIGPDPNNPDTHPFQMMFPEPGYDYTIKWLCRSPGPMRPGVDGWGMSGWVQLPAAGSGINGEIWSFQPVDRAGPQLGLQLRLVNGLPSAFILYPGGQQVLWTLPGVTLDTQPRWTFCGVHFNSQPDGIRVSMKIGSVYNSLTAALPLSSSLVYEPVALAFGRTIVPFTNFSIWYQPFVPDALNWRGQEWTAMAHIDPGVNWIGGVEDIINRESYDLLKEIVEAEFGTFYFDEEGVPYFRSRIVDHGWNRPPERLTSERELTDLVVSVDDSSVRNSINYEYGVTATGPWEQIWEPDDPNYFVINPGVTNSYILPIPENIPIVSETDGVTVKWVSSELWDQIEDNPYYMDKVVFCVSLMSDQTVDVWQGIQTGQLPAGGSMTFRIRRLDPRNVYVQIGNNFSYTIRLATASKRGTNASTGLVDNSMTTEGKAAFRLLGRKIKAYPSLVGSVTHDRSILTYGVQSYDLGGRSVWRQTGDSCAILSSLLMEWTAKPRPVLSDVEVPHNPRRKLYDKIILSEPDSFGATVWCTLAARSVTYSADGARDTLTLRPDSPPPGW